MTMLASEPTVLQKAPLSPEPLYRLLFGRPMTELLYAAHDLGIFSALAKQSQTLSELCEELALPKHSAEMVVNTATALGLLIKKDDRYENSPLSTLYLVEGHPFYLGGLLSHFRHQVFPAWDHLQEAVREDRPQMVQHGSTDRTDVFQTTQKLDRDTGLFIGAMHNLSVSDGIVLAESFDFSTYHSLLDIGGGSGALSLAVASRYPDLRATVWDRPAVSSMTKEWIEKSGLTSKVQAVGGNAFSDPWPVAPDVVLMSLFVHAFGLEKCSGLLKKCFDALPSGGCLLIYEPVLDPARTGPLTTLLSSLNMLVCTPSGGDVTAQEYLDWLRQHGFENCFYKPVPAIRHLIGGYKPR